MVKKLKVWSFIGYKKEVRLGEKSTSGILLSGNSHNIAERH